MLLNNLKNKASKLFESSLNHLDTIKSILKKFSIDDNQGCLFPYRPDKIAEDKAIKN